MSVSQRGSSWQAYVSIDGRRFRKTFPDKASALQWEAHVRAKLLNGEAPDEGGGSAGMGKAMTLVDLFERTAATYWDNAKAGRTLRMNGRLVVETIGANVIVTKLDEQVVDAAVATWERQGNSNATINRKLAALSKMLTHAKRLKVIKERPELLRRREVERRMRWYTEDEERQILGCFRHMGLDDFRHMGLDDMWDFCVVAFDTGLRVGEIHKMDNRCVQDGWIRLDHNTKSGRTRAIPMTTRVKSICRSW